MSFLSVFINQLKHSCTTSKWRIFKFSRNIFFKNNLCFCFYSCLTKNKNNQRQRHKKTIKNKKIMNKVLKDKLVGVILGDAHIKKLGSNKAFISFGQSKNKSEYVKY